MTLYELQRQVREHDKVFGWTDDKPEHTVLHMQEELGEISRHMLKMFDYKPDIHDLEELNDELSDLIYLALKLGNHLDLNLDKGWGRIRERYEGK